MALKGSVLLLGLWLWAGGIAFAQTETDQDQEFVRRMQEAELALRKNDFSEAVKKAEEAAKLKPGNLGVLNFFGAVCIRKKEWIKAEEFFKKALEKEPQQFGARFNLAESGFLQKKYSEARVTFSKLQEESSKVVPADAGKLPFGEMTEELLRYKIYLCLLMEGKEPEAKAMQDKFSFDGKTPAYYYANAAQEMRRKNPAKAKDWIGSAIGIYPPILNELFADPFFDFGWLEREGAKETP